MLALRADADTADLLPAGETELRSRPQSTSHAQRPRRETSPGDASRGHGKVSKFRSERGFRFINITCTVRVHAGVHCAYT